jgi:hypothetical protein
MKRQQSSLIFILALLQFSLQSPCFSAEPERVNICPDGRYIYAQGIACTFNTQAGDTIGVTATFFDDYVTTYQTARVELYPYGVFKDQGHNQRVDITKFVDLANARTGAQTKYYMSGYSPGDAMYITTWRERSNLKPTGVNISSSSGDMTTGYYVTTQVPFISHDNVGYQVYASSTATGLDPSYKALKRYNATVCNGVRGGCESRNTIPFSSRSSIPRGKSYLVTITDDTQEHAETDESENMLIQWIDDFFVEQIPSIMRNVAPTWSLAGQFLDRWLNGDVPRTKNPNIGAIDWDGLEEVEGGSTSILMDPSYSNGDTSILAKFNEISSRSFTSASTTKASIGKSVSSRLLNKPVGTIIDLSRPYSGLANARSYHIQHVQYLVGRTSGDYSTQPLDAITAAFGRFSFYLVPFGTAKLLSTGVHARVTVTSVAVHVADSFDFNDSSSISQPLGCWKAPGSVGKLWWSGSECLFNSSFQYYRKMKARGADFNIIMKPVSNIFGTPVTFDVRIG